MMGEKTGGNALLLWLLSLLFASRVLGQAVQRWAPQTFLPQFHAFQGSALPYSVLLSSQVAILTLMSWLSWRVQTGRLIPSSRAANWLVWIGSIYMLVALGRIAVGLVAPAAPAWFRAWIPAAFHVVLAGFVLALSIYHRRGSHLLHGETQQ